MASSTSCYKEKRQWNRIQHQYKLSDHFYRAQQQESQPLTRAEPFEPAKGSFVSFSLFYQPVSFEGKSKLARGHDLCCWAKGSQPLGPRMTEHWGPVHITPEELENDRDFTLKMHQMFSVHTTKKESRKRNNQRPFWIWVSGKSRDYYFYFFLLLLINMMSYYNTLVTKKKKNK